jgi:hypothetical protein
MPAAVIAWGRSICDEPRDRRDRSEAGVSHHRAEEAVWRNHAVPQMLGRAGQATARADRQTEGVRAADHALDVAQSKRDEACGRSLGKTVACRIRQGESQSWEANQRQATAKLVAQARPESSYFAKLVAWASRGAIQPGADDFVLLWLLFRPCPRSAGSC